MQIINKEIKKDLVQITTTDERWYLVDGVYLPSVTWILNYLPKGYAFEQWLKTHGQNADDIRDKAGKRGSVIHAVLEQLLLGKEVKHDDKFLNNITGEMQEITAEEYAMSFTFIDWYNEHKPEVIQTEATVSDGKTAGTVDLVCKIGDQYWVIDFKTSKQIHNTHLIQVANYRKKLEKDYPGIKGGILLIGKGTKKGYQFKPLENEQALETVFEAAYQIWDFEVKQKQPLQRDYPLSLKLNN